MTESAPEPARETDAAETARRHARGQGWASLMARTFGMDVLACPRCGGRLRLIALIEEAAVIDRILRHLGLPTETPAPRPARAPPLLAGVPTRLVGTTRPRCSTRVPERRPARWCAGGVRGGAPPRAARPSRLTHRRPEVTIGA